MPDSAVATAASARLIGSDLIVENCACGSGLRLLKAILILAGTRSGNEEQGCRQRSRVSELVAIVVLMHKSAKQRVMVLPTMFGRSASST